MAQRLPGDNRETGRNVYPIQPKVQTTPILWHRSEIHFPTRHGHLPTYVHPLHLKSTDFCGCSEQGSPIHYVVFTSSPNKFISSYKTYSRSYVAMMAKSIVESSFPIRNLMYFL
ncbi:hypothetical protein AVEN_269030-1 [Araneus ventricosus]|uniref:Uncharacterized protein n=1 Tax=Araneus ventricosus TaxID=182803 RepID=A0A4Y2QES5_ARAVE|nr:hypothetical protein AVEN_269030-1 [Araneus ventricosus]